MGWATVIMAGDAEERAVITASMNAIGQDIMAGTQVVQYAAVDAPRFKGGFASNLATSIVQLGLISVILFLTSRDNEKKVENELENDSESAQKAVPLGVKI